MNILCIVPYKYIKPTNGGAYSILYFQTYMNKVAKVFVAGSSENEITSDIPFQHYPVFSSSPLRYLNPMNVLRMNRIIREQHIQVLVLDHPYLAWMALWFKTKEQSGPRPSLP